MSSSVEHSLCVEYLSVHCALGHRLDAADEGATARHVAEAAQAAAVLAQDEMRHVHNVNRALVQAGRLPQLGPASSIRRNSGSEVALGPLTLAQLERLVERERELASAVEERYARLRPAVAPPNPLFEGDLLEEIRRALDPDLDHSRLPAALEEELHRPRTLCALESKTAASRSPSRRPRQMTLIRASGTSVSSPATREPPIHLAGRQSTTPSRGRGSDWGDTCLRRGH
jgi:hypothetical protein